MKKLTPDIYAKNIYNINYQKLKNKNIKLLCFDLDNTLDEPDRITKKKDTKLEGFLKNLEKDFEVLIVSNNTIKSRVKSFADIYNLNYIEAMRKPFQKKYQTSNIIKNYKKDETIFIGDKIITDVLGARKYGSACILVDSLFPKKKVWYNVIMGVVDQVAYLLSGVKKGKYFEKI